MLYQTGITLILLYQENLCLSSSALNLYKNLLSTTMAIEICQKSEKTSYQSRKNFKMNGDSAHSCLNFKNLFSIMVKKIVQKNQNHF